MRTKTKYEKRVNPLETIQYKIATAREEFEHQMKSGSYPLIYPLLQLAGGEYASMYTEQAWRMFRDGFLRGWHRPGISREKRLKAEAADRTVGICRSTGQCCTTPSHWVEN